MLVNDNYTVSLHRLQSQERTTRIATFYLEVIPHPKAGDSLFCIEDNSLSDFLAEEMPIFLPYGSTVCILWSGTYTVLVHDMKPIDAMQVADQLRSFILNTYCTNVAIGVADAGDGLAEGLYRAERACYEARLDDSPNVRGWHPSMSGVTPSANWTFQHPPTIFPPVLMNWPKSSHQLIQSEVCE